MVTRFLETGIAKLLENFPVVGLLGPRQCGKSTLAKEILQKRPGSVYLDLERSSDLAKLTEPETFLSAQKGRLVCIDEIQRKPDLFPLIRSLVDEWGGNGCFLILGSASRDLLRQSSETLAGRVVYKHLTPFLWEELKGVVPDEALFSRGGFPRSILASNDDMSMEWRESFITTFLERDLLQWRNFTPAFMGRLWQMLAHCNGQTANYSTMANSLGITSATVKNYIDLLEATFMIMVLQPYTSNMGKRLVKAPKLYVSDSGITCALLQVFNYRQLIGHPGWGSVWEQVVLVNIKAHFPNIQYFFYRTSHGAEMDLVVKQGNTVIAIECKATVSPVLSKGNYSAIDDIGPNSTFIAAPVKAGWPVRENIEVVSLPELVLKLNGLFSTNLG
jgi:uncharacterized protein